MAATSDFFGTGGSKTQSYSTNLAPDQAAMLNKILGVYSQTVGKAPNIYQGTRVAPLTGLQTDVLGSMPNYLSLYSAPTPTGSRPLEAQTGGTIGKLLSGEGGAQPYTGKDVEDYFSKAIYNPTMRMMKEDVMPTIEEGYTGGNLFGTAKGKAQAKAAEDVASSLGQQRAQLTWDVLGRNQEIANAQAERALAAVPQAMQFGREPSAQTLANLEIAAGQVSGMKELFGFGAAEQTQEQRELESQIAKFAEEQQITDPTNLAILLQLLGINGGTTYSKGVETGPGLGLTMLGSLMKQPNSPNVNL